MAELRPNLYIPAQETFLFIPRALIILHLTTNGKALQSATLYCLEVN